MFMFVNCKSNKGSDGVNIAWMYENIFLGLIIDQNLLETAD